MAGHGVGRRSGGAQRRSCHYGWAVHIRSHACPRICLNVIVTVTALAVLSDAAINIGSRHVVSAVVTTLTIEMLSFSGLLYGDREAPRLRNRVVYVNAYTCFPVLTIYIHLHGQCA